MVTPVFEVATLAELSEWFGKAPTTLLVRFIRESLKWEHEVLRKSGSTWLVDVRFALSIYTPVKERPQYDD